MLNHSLLLLNDKTKKYPEDVGCFDVIPGHWRTTGVIYQKDNSYLGDPVYNSRMVSTRPIIITSTQGYKIQISGNWKLSRLWKS